RLKIADVVRHEARARRKDRQIASALAHFRELIDFDALAQFVVADLELGDARRERRVLEAGDLPVAPVFERLWRGRVMAVTIDDHAVFPFRCRTGPRAL